MKKTIISISIWVLLFGAIVTGWKLYFNERANSRRLSHNIEALTTQAETFKARNGQQAARIAAQEVTIKELKKNTVLANKLKNLYIKPQRVKAFTETTSNLNAEFTAPIRETYKSIEPIPAATIINPDTTGTTANNLVTVRTLKYSDPWLTLQAEMRSDSDTGKVSVAAVDTVFTAIHQGRRYKPLLWIFSRRKLEATATNTNPYISITVIQSGIVKK